MDIDCLITHLQSQKTGEKHHDFCIDDAVFHLEKAQEALLEGMAQPKKWYEDALFTAKTFQKCMPFIYLVQESLQRESHTQTHQAVES